ncbi:hypothetical protein L9G16_10425 [Shewanella sp. A25]|nr:hypothetical protein [Shewanella shenzhenensis]
MTVKCRTLLLCSLLLGANNGLQAEENVPFYFDTYTFAINSEVLSEAAKCQLLEQQLNIKQTVDYKRKAIIKLSMEAMDLNLYSHELVEYELAFMSVANYHYGKFEVMHALEKDAAQQFFKSLYDDSNCSG